MIKIWTDGACTVQGTYAGVGGCAYRIEADKVECEDKMAMKDTTNNRMEIQAVIMALQQLLDLKHLFSDDKVVIIYSDSELVVNTLKKDATWKQKKNLDKWAEVNTLTKKLNELGFDIDYKWVKAHTDKSFTQDIYINNKRVDKLAQEVRDELKFVLEHFSISIEE